MSMTCRDRWSSAALVLHLLCNTSAALWRFDCKSRRIKCKQKCEICYFSPVIKSTQCNRGGWERKQSKG